MYDQEHLKSIIRSALDKLRVGMENGPTGEPVVLTPEEATVIYRLMTEHN